jgi:hypothetical protein
MGTTPSFSTGTKNRDSTLILGHRSTSERLTPYASEVNGIIVNLLGRGRRTIRIGEAIGGLNREYWQKENCKQKDRPTVKLSRFCLCNGKPAIGKPTRLQTIMPVVVVGRAV